MIEAVIFDLGRVLVGIDFSRGLLGALGVSSPEKISMLAADRDFIAYSSGLIEPQEFYQRARSKYNLELSFTEFSALWCNIFLEMEGMQELVAALAGHYKLGLLSDTDPLHWRTICDSFAWVESTFVKPVLSYNIGVMKPDQQAFAAAVASVGVDPQRCLFVDDLPQNIQGAREFGMEAILFKGRDELILEFGRCGLCLD